MEKTNSVTKAKHFAKTQSIKISEKTLEKTEEANEFLLNTGEVFLFITTVIRETFSRGFEFREFLRQCFQIGYKSLPLISVTGIIMGLVLTIQSRPTLLKFGAVTMLPGMVALSLIREMGPVITALICAGKIGSGMGAELGSMKVTEQIDAMEVSSTNPVKFLIVTRILAATLMIPLLILYADGWGILGQLDRRKSQRRSKFCAIFFPSFWESNLYGLFSRLYKIFLFWSFDRICGLLQRIQRRQRYRKCRHSCKLCSRVSPLFWSLL